MKVVIVMIMKAVMAMTINSMMMMFVESMYSIITVRHTYPSYGSRATFHLVTTKDTTINLSKVDTCARGRTAI